MDGKNVLWKKRAPLPEERTNNMDPHDELQNTSLLSLFVSRKL